jgi:transcriptional regulator with XRE-family HTH domain
MRGGYAVAFAKVLRMLREARGISQYKLAKLLNTTPSLISRYESGQRSPRRETVRAIAEALALTPEERKILYHAAGFIVDDFTALQAEVWYGALMGGIHREVGVRGGGGG